MNIAVIGAGVAGITAAYLLQRAHNVTLFERDSRLGGHTNTIVLADGPDAGTAVDTGFIVCNTVNYPHFYKLMGQFGVKLRNAEMTFGFYREDPRLQYIGPAIREFLREPRNLLQPQFLGLLREQRRFNNQALNDLESGALVGLQLKDYLKQLDMSPYFVSTYVIPLVAAIWSSPANKALDFPALTFAHFFKNHGMFTLRKRPQWQTVIGGSHSYLQNFEKIFKGEIRLHSHIARITRNENGVTLQFADNSSVNFDQVVLATHADQALALLEDSSLEERSLLGPWDYRENDTVLHTDASVLPGKRKLWASWNYQCAAKKDPSAPLAITYYMNKLQGLQTTNDYFVSLNQTERIDPKKIIYRTTYTHPQYTLESVRTQDDLRALNGTRNTFYCGSYLRYGFHEDAVSSAVDVASHFGINL